MNVTIIIIVTVLSDRTTAIFQPFLDNLDRVLVHPHPSSPNDRSPSSNSQAATTSQPYNVKKRPTV